MVSKFKKLKTELVCKQKNIPVYNTVESAFMEEERWCISNNIFMLDYSC